jgi:hypothetical protein
MRLSSIIKAITLAHAKTGAPGQVVGLRDDGRYVVALDAFKRKAFPASVDAAKGTVTIRPAWTEHKPDGKSIRCRKMSTQQIVD